MSVADLRAVSLIVGKSVLPEDLYGNLTGSKNVQLNALKHEYRRLIEIVHPDKYQGTPEIRVAHTAFLQATKLKNDAEQKIEAGTYGDRTKTAQPPDPDPPPTVVEVKKRKYILTRRFAQGDVCDLYDCTFSDPLPPPPKPKVDDKKPHDLWSTLMEPDEDVVDNNVPMGAEHRAVFKIVQSAADNDLLENEAKILAKLYPAAQADEKYFRYLPRLIDSFTFKTKGGSKRQVCVLPKFDEYFSMADVLAAHPAGLDFRDVMWMYRRLIIGLGYVHTQNVVHGAVLPSHVLLHPVDHGGRIIGWSYAVADGKAPIKAISKPYKHFYAPEVLDKKTPTPATDIYMAAKCAIALLGGDPTSGAMPASVPRPIQNFFTACIIANPARRPNDAWALHDDLDEILHKLVGPKSYRATPAPK